MPMYLDYDSVDLWSNTHLFHLDHQTMKPTLVSGIYFLSFYSSHFKIIRKKNRNDEKRQI